jgi:hypothetical protein
MEVGLMRTRIAIAVGLVFLLAALPVLAGKELPAVPDKSGEANEPYWNPNPGNGILADVPEDETVNNTCPGQAFTCGDVLRPAGITAGDVDYIYFTANAGDYITFGTDGDPTVMDTKVYLYNADCSVQLAYDDDSGPGLASLITNYFACYTGVYVGKITGYGTTTTGTYKAFVTCAPSGIVLTPYGETCALATPLACGNINLTGNSTCNVNDYSMTSGGCTGYTSAGKDVVLSLTVAAGGFVSLSYQLVSPGDASFYILDTCDPVHCLVGADATYSGGIETLNYTFAAAGTYYLVLDSYGASSNWTLTGTFDCGTVGVDPASWTNVKSLYR